jgi:hypothetical protein
VVQIEGLQPLAQSIAAHGVLQPLLVRSEGDTYRLIAGRRRLAAARMARLSRVPCLIHQVDDQEAQALTRAANIRAREEAAPASAPARDAGADVLNDLSAVVASMQSAAAMLAGRGTAIGQRVALDLLQAEARRADWQLRAAAIVGNRHPWQPRRVVLGPIVIRVCESFAAEARLNGIELRPEIPDWNVATSVDEDALACAISGALLATLALAEPSDARTITLALRTSADGSPVVDVTQSAATLPAGGAGRFFDLSWTERPGGWTAALGAATAMAVAERTGGSGILIARDGRGSAIRLTFGR